MQTRCNYNYLRLNKLCATSLHMLCIPAVENLEVAGKAEISKKI